ncbi:MAG: hypothetical protein FWF81_05290 [Defluviitaleaceae bacterium]|nr:hypothetical protein [Defluviitaleaceae bacterium]
MTTAKLEELIKRGVVMSKNTDDEIAIWRNEVFDPIIYSIRYERGTLDNACILPIEERVVMFEILEYLTPIAKRDDVTEAYRRLCIDFGKEPKH